MGIAAALSWVADSAARRPHRLPISRPGVILSPMSLVLSPATEARIQAELATGRYAAPDELLNRALDSLNASLEADRTMNEPAPKEMEDWLLRNKDAVNAALDESFAAKERGETYSMEEAEAILAERRAARSRQAA